MYCVCFRVVAEAQCRVAGWQCEGVDCESPFGSSACRPRSSTVLLLAWIRLGFGHLLVAQPQSTHTELVLNYLEPLLHRQDLVHQLAQ